jgi:hypothetical protein
VPSRAGALGSPFSRVNVNVNVKTGDATASHRVEIPITPQGAVEPSRHLLLAMASAASIRRVFAFPRETAAEGRAASHCFAHLQTAQPQAVYERTVLPV